MAAQALNVLEESMNINGGPNAREVFWMSMHISLDQMSAVCTAAGTHLSCCTLWVLKVSAVVTVVDRDGDGDWRRRHRRHWAEVGCHQY